MKETGVAPWRSKLWSISHEILTFNKGCIQIKSHQWLFVTDHFIDMNYLSLSFSCKISLNNRQFQLFLANNTKMENIVRSVSREVKLTFILCLDSNGNAFYLYTAIGAACSSTPCNAHAWLYRGCGYCWGFTVPCNIGSNFHFTLQIYLIKKILC